MEEESNEQYVRQLEQALQQEQSKYNQLAHGTSSVFTGGESENLIEFQLELDDIQIGRASCRERV